MNHAAFRCLSLAALGALAAAFALPACAPGSSVPDSSELTGAPETADANQSALTGSLTVGETLIATSNVNLRNGPSTSNAILHVIPSGATVTLLAASPKNGFYNVKHSGSTGWAYGPYLKEASPGGGTSSSSSSSTSTSTSGGGVSCSVGGVSGTCIDVGACAALTGHVSTAGHCPGAANIECCTPTGGSSSSSSGGTSSGGTSSGGLHADAMARAQSAMGFSYWWGHGRFLTAGPTSSTTGSCSGSCPSCTHGGSYGGDCSGLAAKVWQVPASNSDLSVDEHPYSTGDFVSDTALWSTVSRGSLQTADAMVYNSGGAGHIFIYNSGDGWGSMDVFECKGCSYGCVHDVRTASSAYHGIRRAGY